MSSRLHLATGAFVRAAGTTYEIVRADSDRLGWLYCREVGGDEIVPLPVSSLSPVEESTASARPLEAISAEGFQQAQWRYEVIAPLLNGRTSNAVTQRAKACHVSRASIYRWIKRWSGSEDLRALVDLPNPGTTGKYSLDARTENITAVGIDEYYLTEQRRTIQDTCDEVLRRCRREGVPEPHRHTVVARINRLDPQYVAQRRGLKKKARDTYAPRPGTFSEAEAPLSIVEIDSTKLDIEVVDKESRMPLERPWLTLAVDVFSRVVTGFTISLADPGSAEVGACLVMSICRKEGFLRSIGVDADWPIWGFPRVIHSDNGRPLTSLTIVRACEQYGIMVARRPVGSPHWGGHIERLLGRAGANIHTLPGTTFSNIGARDEYDSKARAGITLEALNTWFARWVTRIYHETIHTSLGVTPLARLRDGIFGLNGCFPAGYQDAPADERQIRLDFMPAFERPVHPQGVVIGTIWYYDNILEPFIRRPGRGHPSVKLLFRQDPSDVTRIYFRHPDTGVYHEVHCSNLTRPPTTLSEFNAARRRLKQQRLPEDPERVFDAIEENQRLISLETAKTAETRKTRNRRRTGQRHSPTHKRTEARSVEVTASDHEVDREVLEAALPGDYEPYGNL
jgi:putative transposase